MAPTCPERTPTACSAIKAIALAGIAAIAQWVGMPLALASPTPAPVVFVHAAPIGPAAAGATFSVGNTEVASLQPLTHTREIAVEHGVVTLSARVPGMSSPVTVTTSIVADQPYTVLLAGDNIRQPYTLVVRPTFRMVPMPGYTVWVPQFGTATDPASIGQPGGTQYSSFMACGTGFGFGGLLFGGGPFSGQIFSSRDRRDCRAGLFNPSNNSVATQASFELRIGRRVQVYFTGNGIEMPLRTHLIELDDEPELVPRPMGEDMVGLWSSRTRSGESLVVQTAAGGVGGIYAGFDDDGRPAWSTLSPLSAEIPNVHRLLAAVPLDGDATGARPFASLVTEVGSIIFLSCREALVETQSRGLFGKGPDVFFSARTREVQNVVRLSRITAPNGCIDP